MGLDLTIRLRRINGTKPVALHRSPGARELCLNFLPGRLGLYIGLEWKLYP